MMIPRTLLSPLVQALHSAPVVCLLGPRQVGKATLAYEINKAYDNPLIYLDLERPSDLAKLRDPELYLTSHFGRTVVLDEIQRMPELFPLLRSLVDEQIRKGTKTGQYLILGSASPELILQSSESLAGRIQYLELEPITLKELLNAKEKRAVDHWLRGGFPNSLLTAADSTSLTWRRSFIQTYLERDLPQLGLKLPAEQLRRFWTMLAYGQSNPLNATKLAASMGLSGTTIRKYIDLLTQLYLLRQLKPWAGNSLKRLVKAPKLYVRDSGLLHALIDIPNEDVLISQPVCGDSWEGYVIENICACIPKDWRTSYYRTGAQAEIDLVLEPPTNKTYAIEIKRTLSPNISKGFRLGAEDIGATDRFYVIPSGERYPLDKQTEAIPLAEFITVLSDEV